MTPLTPSDRMRRIGPDGRSLAHTAKEIIKPNDRLTAFERLEIYNRQYWFRILDGLSDDFPGLRAVLGDRRFNKLSQHYLTDCPSRSFTMRDLGSRLENWLAKRPQYAPGRLQLALDMVRLEWAEIEAFDAAFETPLTATDLTHADPGSAHDPYHSKASRTTSSAPSFQNAASPGAQNSVAPKGSIDPAKLRLRLQPYIRLLPLHYPVDDLLLAIKQDTPADIASNAMEERQKRKKVSAVARLEPAPVFLAVHRIDNTVYFRRLEREEFTILDQLRRGRTLEQAISAAFRQPRTSKLTRANSRRKSAPGKPTTSRSVEQRAADVASWFQNWSSLGWFVRQP